MEKFHERESSKRSWPWKKKSNDKVSAAPEQAGAASPVLSSRLIEDHHQKWDYRHQEVPVLSQYQPSPPRVPKHLKEIKEAHDREKAAHDRSRAALEEARTQWKRAEEKARAMNEKLANALADITTKDNLVQQHAKVAEEAVTGWEKAEAEAMALKMQLDAALQQKLATEDRVAHLDGALKECMKQLRLVREDQEQRLHDNLVKKTREHDKIRADLETKLAESSHFLAQTRNDLLESRAEVTALTHACQERSRSIVEMSEAKGKIETEIKVLQVRLETIEKENSHLKYEVHVLNKELEIRSEEREYERKAVDMASKQHLESVKKIAKLEEECNRLRLLVRKKLPGPAAIQRMRMEVEGIGKDTADKARRRSLGRSASSAVLEQHSSNSATDENGPTREAQLLAERVVAMDEEMKVLKDALVQRNSELQTSRLMCSKTATRLSVVEEELNRALKQQNGPLNLVNGPNTQKQATGEGKGAPDRQEPRRDSQNFELMDDFFLMERLAMTEALAESGMATQTISMSQEVDSKPTGTTEEQQHLEASLAAKERELGEAVALCEELKAKLAEAETQISALQSRNAVNETSLINLQDQLDRLNEEHAKLMSGGNTTSGCSDTVKDVIRDGSKGGENITASAELGGASSSSSDGDLLAPRQDQHACDVSDAESKASTVHSELATAVRKILRIVEALAQATGTDHRTSEGDHAPSGEEVALQFEWENLGVDEMMRNLAHVSNRFLQGKYDLIDFVTELGTALDSILALKPIVESGSVELQSELERVKSEKAEIESRLAEAAEQVERLGAQLFHKTPSAANRDQGDESPDAGHKEDDMIEEELLQLSSPNPALRAASGELSKMQDKVATLERELNGERQRHESVVAQLTALQQQVRRGHAVSSEMSGLSHGDFSSHSTSDDDDDDDDDETKSLKQRTVEAARKEEEEQQMTAAAALAECQRTILALGKQLKGGRATDQPSPNSIQKTTTENMELPRSTSSSLSMHNHTPSAIKDRAGTPARRAPVRSPSPANHSRNNSPASSFSYHHQNRQHSALGNSPQASDHGVKLQRSSSGVRGLQVRN